MLNCKVNSTNRGTFSKSAASLFWCFFGPGGLSYVQIGPGIQNFTKISPAYLRTCAYAPLGYEQAYLAISLEQKEQCMRLNNSFQMGQI